MLHGNQRVVLALLMGLLLLARCPEAFLVHAPPSPPAATPRGRSRTTIMHMEKEPPTAAPKPRTIATPALLGRVAGALAALLPLASLPGAATAAAAAAIPQPSTTAVLLASASPAAAANLPDDVLAAALISLSKGASLDRLTAPAAEGQAAPSPALYVTARIGARGRVLASVRVPLADLPNGGFPAEVTVRTADVYADTPEAREEVARGIRTQDLVLSARLDRDGQAATRDPEDLVGQGAVYKFGTADSAQWSRATIELGGRGAFGELVTGKRK